MQLWPQNMTYERYLQERIYKILYVLLTWMGEVSLYGLKLEY